MLPDMGLVKCIFACDPEQQMWKLTSEVISKYKGSAQQMKQSRGKWQPMEWEKIFTNYSFEKELIS
jgi:hypothetical protein